MFVILKVGKRIRKEKKCKNYFLYEEAKILNYFFK